jgi:hypothetical protein
MINTEGELDFAGRLVKNGQGEFSIAYKQFKSRDPPMHVQTDGTGISVSEY